MRPRDDRDPPRRQPAGVARRSHGPRRRGRHRPGPGQGRGRRAGGRRDPRPRAARSPTATPSQIVTPKSGDDYLYVMRHSAAHVMAEAVQALVPGHQARLRPADRGRLLLRLRPAAAAHRGRLPGHRGRDGAASSPSKAPFQRSVMSIDDARAYFAERGEPYKVDQIDELARQGETSVSLYRAARLRRPLPGPAPAGHRPHRRRQAAVGRRRLLARQREEPPAHPRLRHRVPHRRKELEAHLERLEQARARDHRRLGRELELFHFDDAGPGFPFFLPQRDGRRQRHQGGRARGARRMGYDEIQTPDAALGRALAAAAATGTTTASNMYFTEVDEARFALKPMNCPGACLVYRSRRHSYRDLPIRYAEFGHVHRHELSGVLHGLFRVRAFTQDDAHIFCRLDQVHRGGARGPRPHPSASTRASASSTSTLKLATRPGEGERRAGDVGRGRGGAARGAGRPPLRAQGGRRRLLRPEDRLPRHRHHGPLVAARHLPARLLHARALRPDLHHAPRTPRSGR